MALRDVHLDRCTMGTLMGGIYKIFFSNLHSCCWIFAKMFHIMASQ